MSNESDYLRKLNDETARATWKQHDDATAASMGYAIQFGINA